jgi:hypothetical protein
MGERMIWDFESVLKAEKQKSVKGATYYVMHFEPQFGEPFEMSQDIYDSIQAVGGLVSGENKRVEEAWKKANMDMAEAQADEALMDHLDALEADVA